MTHNPYKDGVAKDDGAGTAGEFMIYVEKNVGTKGVVLVRQTNAAQNWQIISKGGKIYNIRMSQYFGKKHLVTFSKKADKIEKLITSATETGKSAEQARAEALKESAYQKAANVFTNRSGEVVCQNPDCQHTREKHVWTKSKGVHCTGLTTGVTCTCTKLVTPFITNSADKYGENPFIGAKIAQSTAIVLTLIPAALFKDAIVSAFDTKESVKDSKKLEKPGTAADEYVLRWDFSANKDPCVVQIAKERKDWKEYRGCHVLGKLVASEKDSETWEIAHMYTESELKGALF